MDGDSIYRDIIIIHDHSLSFPHPAAGPTSFPWGLMDKRAESNESSLRGMSNFSLEQSPSDHARSQGSASIEMFPARRGEAGGGRKDPSVVRGGACTSSMMVFSAQAPLAPVALCCLLASSSSGIR